MDIQLEIAEMYRVATKAIKEMVAQTKQISNKLNHLTYWDEEKARKGAMLKKEANRIFYNE